MLQLLSVHLKLPEWFASMRTTNRFFDSDNAKMQFVLDLTDKNVQNDTGGPFGAAIFYQKTGELISAGVNVVVSMNCSIAHAEVMAIIFAQHKLSLYRLGDGYELFSSAQPCFMCTGALMWSGVRRLVYAADRHDVESILGFDEGPLPEHIENELTARNIRVTKHLLRTPACSILQSYKQRNGVIY
ncbi:nucleoside deaminase [candidate division KSB1 bacterium]|nr:nucleoside deaminase [candidate division KSB1 bacterium]